MAQKTCAAAIWFITGLSLLLQFDGKLLSPSNNTRPIDWGRLGDPVLFKSHPEVQRWKMSKLTADGFIGEVSGPLTNTYISSDRFFPYFDPAEIQSSLFRNDFKAPFSLGDIPKESIFRIDDNHFKLYSGNVLLPAFQKIKHNIRVEILTNHSVTATIWAGSHGSQSPAHHDLAYNLYIQLTGEKNFMLYPHSAVCQLCIHGRYHPHSRQSRYVDIRTLKIINTTRSSAGSAERWYSDLKRIAVVRELCKVDQLDGYEVSLMHGDVLFIPPFWYHEVESVRDSVSLSLWWDSDNMLNAIDGLYEIPLPFESDWDFGTTLGAVFLFSAALVADLEETIAKMSIINSTLDQCDMNTSVDDGSGLYSMLQRRYIEDYLAISCSDLSVRHFIETIDADRYANSKFKERAKAYTRGFFNIREEVPPSNAFDAHQNWAMRSKALDYIEEIFFNFASRSPFDVSNTQEDYVISNMVLWLKCYIQHDDIELNLN